jgi:membrane peptidoglycan carboxypeptidase
VDIQTTLDVALQKAAEAAERAGIKRIERERPALAGQVQAAVVAIEPTSGQIRAVVGGRGFRESPFNRATRAVRQPGSLFKPFVYLAAFEAEYRRSRRRRSSPTNHSPPRPAADAGAEEHRRAIPRTRHGEARGGGVTNVPAVRVGLAVGAHRIADVAHALGIEHALAPVPSLALGTSEVTLLEITTASPPSPMGACESPLTALAHDGGGLALFWIASPVRAVSAESAFLTTHLLRGVMRRGTGRQARPGASAR